MPAIINSLFLLLYLYAIPSVSPRYEAINPGYLDIANLLKDYNKYGVMDSTISNNTKFPEGYIVQGKEYWIVDHYEPIPGKILGVWPKDRTQIDLHNLKNKWGYSGIFCQEDPAHYALATSPEIGFAPQNIMQAIAYNKGVPQRMIDILANTSAGMYYIDEPVEHGCLGNNDPHRIYQDWELKEIYSRVNSHPNATFVTSGYKRCDHLDFLSENSDQLMFSSYKAWDWSIYPGCNTNVGWGPAIENIWVPNISDQRSSWTDMKKRYGSKFTMSWIRADEYDEFTSLFEHAKSLELTGIWVYALETDSVPWEQISEAAFNNGILRKFERKYVNIYSCDTEEGCTGVPPYGTGWRLVESRATSIIKEVIR